MRLYFLVVSLSTEITEQSYTCKISYRSNNNHLLYVTYYYVDFIVSDFLRFKAGCYFKLGFFSGNYALD